MKPAIDAQIDRILQKLFHTKQSGRTCFGSNTHHFELNPPLSEEIIAGFEKDFGVLLPEDYRAFLIKASNGGAGPYYGISPLGNWYDGSLESPAGDRDILARPFPLSYQSTLLSHASSPKHPNYELHKPGSIYLCDQGCTYCARLVVSGEARGRIIYLDQSGTGAPYFVKDAGFLDWYERWLDSVLAGQPPTWSGFDNPDYDTSEYVDPQGLPQIEWQPRL